MKLIKAIDVHGHYGIRKSDLSHELINTFMSADGEQVAAWAREAGIEFTCVSPLLGLFPRGRADAVAGNKEAARVVSRTPGLLQWVIVHPLQPATYEQARRMLKRPGCVGIKIHPEEHCYAIRKHGRAIFEFAAEQRAIVLTHSGEKNSWPIDFIPFVNEFPEVRLILAHLGNTALPSGQPDHQVRAIQASKHGNVYTDTSSMRSIFPRLIEWGVKEVGADRILFGTDTPLYFPWMQRVRIDRAELTTQQKRMILRENAARLFAGKIPL